MERSSRAKRWYPAGWSAKPRGRRRSAYAGTSPAGYGVPPRHHDAVTSLASALAAEGARSRHCGVPDLLLPPGSAVGYWHYGTNYVVHPDVSFTLDLPDDHRACFLETIALRGILGDTWRRPALNPTERLPLHQLAKRELSRSQDFL